MTVGAKRVAWVEAYRLAFGKWPTGPCGYLYRGWEYPAWGQYCDVHSCSDPWHGRCAVGRVADWMARRYEYHAGAAR